MLEDVTNYGKMCRMEHFSALFSNLFPQKRKRISANTCVYFGKYAHVFPQIFLRISANKFGADLKKRRFVCSRDGFAFCPQRGHFGRVRRKRRPHAFQSLLDFLFFAIERMIGNKTIMRMIPKPT